MPDSTYPGVYVEELPDGRRPIDAAPTSVAAFVGQSSAGEQDIPRLIDSLSEFEAIFATRDANGQVKEENYKEPMWQAMRAFFLNGGGRAYVANIGDSGADYRSLFKKLTRIREIGVLVLPGADRPPKGIRDAAVAHCAVMKNRIYITDPENGRELTTQAVVAAQQFPTGDSYTVTYYPWVWAPNPAGGDPLAVCP